MSLKEHPENSRESQVQGVSCLRGKLRSLIRECGEVEKGIGGSKKRTGRDSRGTEHAFSTSLRKEEERGF